MQRIKWQLCCWSCVHQTSAAADAVDNRKCIGYAAGAAAAAAATVSAAVVVKHMSSLVHSIRSSNVTLLHLLFQ